MASIVNRGPYQFQATIRKKGFPRKTKTFERKSDALAWVTAEEARMASGNWRNLKTLDHITLRDLLLRYQQERTVEKLGAKQEHALIKRLLQQELAGRYLSQLSPEIFTDYKRLRLSLVQEATVRLELMLLSAVFKKAAKGWHIPVPNHIREIELPSQGNPRSRRLEGNEEHRLLEAALSLRCGSSLHAVIVFAIETGIRQGRIATLIWEKVDLTPGEEGVWILTKAQKSQQEEMFVPLSEVALNVLRSFPLPHQGRVFKEFPTGNAIGQAFSRACDRAGIADLHFHDLRHESASRLAPMMPASTLAKLMGWKCIQMAMRYYNPKPKELVRARRKADEERRAA